MWCGHLSLDLGENYVIEELGTNNDRQKWPNLLRSEI